MKINLNWLPRSGVDAADAKSGFRGSPSRRAQRAFRRRTGPPKHLGEVVWTAAGASGVRGFSPKLLMKWVKVRQASGALQAPARGVEPARSRRRL